MLKILSTCAILTFLLVSSAMAQSGVGACAADIKNFCANIEPGNLRIATCVKEHLADLSDVCKARLAEVAAAGKTCRADVEKQCGTERRRIQKVACVRDAISNFGDDCKAAIAAVVTRKK
ncbi:MAG: cysteine rich repeat-containing protein [Xanthobacteraceae bacterium]